MTARPSETGAALINVLILVGILSVLATVMIDRMRLAQRLQVNVAERASLRQGLAAAEVLMLARLPDTRAQTLVLPQGKITARPRDAGLCFNLNGLVTGTQGSFQTRPLGVQQFARLMMLAGVAEDRARSVAAATADWIDSDDVAGPAGAEDAAYARAAVPYRTGGTLMAGASEWRAVSGVGADVHARLRAYLCALPEAELSRINVNALRPDQAVLLAMLTGGTVDSARAIIAARPRAGWASREAFWADPALAAVRPPADVLGQVTTAPVFTALDMTIAAGGNVAEQSSLVRMDGGRMDGGRPRVIARHWSLEE